MAFEDIREHVSEADARLRSYVGESMEYYQLKGFKFLMRGITTVSKTLFIAAIGIMALFFLSLAASFGIGQWLNNTFYGFLCVGLFYAVLGLLAYFFRDRLNRPLIRKFSEYYFEE